MDLILLSRLQRSVAGAMNSSFTEMENYWEQSFPGPQQQTACPQSRGRLWITGILTPGSRDGSTGKSVRCASVRGPEFNPQDPREVWRLGGRVLYMELWGEGSR